LAFARRVEKMMTVSDGTTRKADKPAPGAKKPTRQAQLRKMLTRKSGVSIAQIQKAFGWQPHTARAAISAQRKAGFEISRSETNKGPGYRIVERGGNQ
jgi:predicted DNA-binding transcriptional regulator YafY